MLRQNSKHWGRERRQSAEDGFKQGLKAQRAPTALIPSRAIQIEGSRGSKALSRENAWLAWSERGDEARQEGQ